jgi:hypothetical protein
LRDARERHPSTLQTTVAVNGTVRMVPRDLKRYRSSHMLQKLRLALGRCFGMPHGIYPDVCDRVRGLDPPLGDELKTHSQGTTRFRRRCLRMPREIESMAITAGMVVLALSLRMDGLCVDGP